MWQMLMCRCGMNQWHTKPCSRTTIHKIVTEARELLVQTKQELGMNTE